MPRITKDLIRALALMPKTGQAAVGSAMYTNTQKWEASCPASLMPGVRALRSRFEDAHWKVGSITEKLVYSFLHDEGAEGVKKNLPYLLQLKQIAGPLASQRFNEIVEVGTLPAAFRAFLNFYQDILALEIAAIFKNLLEIGAANANDLSGNMRDWAKQQSIHLIRSEAYRVTLWVRTCCDPINSLEIDTLKWRAWQAPKLLTMTPAQQSPYVARAVWHRLDAEDSQELLKHFEQFYVIHLEIVVERAWQTATIEAAKEPPSARSTTAEVPTTSDDVGDSEEVQVRNKEPTLNVRQLFTRRKHDSWRREYQRQRKQRPGKTDVWYSQQIAKLAMADGASSETIRKNMK